MAILFGRNFRCHIWNVKVATQVPQNCKQYRTGWAFLVARGTACALAGPEKMRRSDGRARVRRNTAKQYRTGCHRIRTPMKTANSTARGPTAALVFCACNCFFYNLVTAPVYWWSFTSEIICLVTDYGPSAHDLAFWNCLLANIWLFTKLCTCSRGLANSAIRILLHQKPTLPIAIAAFISVEHYFGICRYMPTGCNFKYATDR
jgi:hypothetical protein